DRELDLPCREHLDGALALLAHQACSLEEGDVDLKRLAGLRESLELRRKFAKIENERLVGFDLVPKTAALWKADDEVALCRADAAAGTRVLSFRTAARGRTALATATDAAGDPALARFECVKFHGNYALSFLSASTVASAFVSLFGVRPRIFEVASLIP